ncbi:HAD hydrolase-like protein [Candidatus Pacearchaeota archaeon]|nr:HAD hydrolase-like protein [Candidatus Pacearchaeota archaeon]
MVSGVIKGVIFDFNWTLYNPRDRCEVDGATRLLKDLVKEDYFLGIVTKDKNRERRGIIDSLKFWEYASVVYTKGKKTEKDFEKCIRAMNPYLEPFEVAVVGDNLLSEIYLGNMIGFRTVRFKFGEFSEEKPGREFEKPNYQITKLYELMNCLK